MTDRSPPDLSDRDEDAALCAEYALGLLSPAELAAFEARMQVDPAFRAQAILWTEDMAALADSIPPQAPPPAVEAALHARLFPEKRESWWRSLGLIPAILGGLAAALLVLWAGSSGLLLQLDPPAGPIYNARIAAADDSIVAAVAIAPDNGALNLHLIAGTAPPGRVLELWLIAGESPPVSLGVLTPDSNLTLPLPDGLPADLAGAILALSEEPPGGSPTGQPTGAVLATGPLTTL